MSFSEIVFRSQPEEHAFAVAEAKVEGEIPRALAGTFLRTGPGLLEAGDTKLNFFDGHALVAGLSFNDGKAVFRSRFVQTPLYLREKETGSMQKRRVFTNLPSRWKNLFALDFGNNAMHDVYAWGDKVIAGFDMGHWALDAKTLATKGPEDWNGLIPQPGKGHEMSPMPYRDPATGRLVVWRKSIAPGKPDQLGFVELDDTLAVVKKTRLHKLVTGPALVHDHRATKRWYVATEQAVRLSPAAAIWGAKTVFECLQAPPGSSAALYLVPRAAGEGAQEDRLIRISLPTPYEIAFHIINAFDDGENVVVDLVCYPGRIRFSAAIAKAARQGPDVDGPTPTLMRFVVDPAKGELVSSKKLTDTRGDGPEIADERMGQPYRFAYLPTTEPKSKVPVDHAAYFQFDAIAKIDLDSGKAATWTSPGVVSQLAFVARAGEEDDGWLLTWLLEESGASVLVLDAKKPEAGPIATVRLGIHLPGVSHTRWAAGVQLDP